jgi:hypothetical protein
VRAGAPDRSLTANAGLAAVSVLCDRLGVIEALEARSARSSGGTRGLGAGAADRDRGGATGREDFVGPDHQRADAAGQRITPVPGRRRGPRGGWARRMLSLLPAEIVLATDLRGGTDDPRATTPLTTSTSASRSAPGGPAPLWRLLAGIARRRLARCDRHGRAQAAIAGTARHGGRRTPGC